MQAHKEETTGVDEDSKNEKINQKSEDENKEQQEAAIQTNKQSKGDADEDSDVDEEDSLENDIAQLNIRHLKKSLLTI